MDQRWRALAVLTTARTSLGLQFQSLASVSPMLVPELGLGWGDLGFLIGLYFLPGIVIALPAGALGSRVGDKRIVMVGLVLMVVGGLLVAVAPDRETLLVGRALSGVGGIVLNVLMSKMVTDWFAGREIVLAMAIFVNAFPIGIGIAMLALGGVASLAGWRVAMLVVAGAAAAALLLVAFACARHPNDRPAGPRADPAAARPGAVDAALVCVAGAIWGLYSGCFGAMMGFMPTFLEGAGFAAAMVAVATGAATWLRAASMQAGGVLAQRGSAPCVLVAVGVIGWAVCLAGLAAGVGPASLLLVATGALGGLPAGAIMALPARILQPAHRAVGMGLFYVWLYVGHGGMPPLAGWLQDRTGSAAAPMWLTAALVAALLPMYLGLDAVLRWRAAPAPWPVPRRRASPGGAVARGAPARPAVAAGPVPEGGIIAVKTG